MKVAQKWRIGVCRGSGLSLGASVSDNHTTYLTSLPDQARWFLESQGKVKSVPCLKLCRVKDSSSRGLSNHRACVSVGPHTASRRVYSQSPTLSSHWRRTWGSRASGRQVGASVVQAESPESVVSRNQRSHFPEGYICVCMPGCQEAMPWGFYCLSTIGCDFIFI